jgi:SNF2 family DNA or RNA helicase
MVYRLISEGTVEEKILSLHQEKRELAERFLEGRDTVQPLKIEELMSLL